MADQKLPKQRVRSKMHRVNFELHINSDNNPMNDESIMDATHQIMMVAETLGGYTNAVLNIVDTKPKRFIECQYEMSAASPFLRVYCDPEQVKVILDLFKEHKLHMDKEFVAMLAFEAATDMLL